MKRLIAFQRVAPMLLSILFAPAWMFAGETVIVDKSFNKREIKVRVGAAIRVELEELGSAGYTWKLKALDQEHFGTPEVETKGAPPQDDFTGAPVLKTWLIKAKKPGQTELRFIHYRPWEDENSASETFYLRVRILP